MTSCTHSYEIFFYYEKFFHMFSNLSTGNAALHCGSRCEQGYSVCTYMAWNIQLHQPCKMICPGFSKKNRHRITTGPSNSTSGNTLKTESRVSKRCLSARVPSSIIHNSQKVKQPWCPLVDEQRNKTGVHTAKHRSAFHRTLCHMLPHAWTLRTLSSVNSTSYKKTATLWDPLYEVLGVIKLLETESRMVATRGRGTGS